MQLALASRSLGAASPLEEDIRVAAITSFPWLVQQLSHPALGLYLDVVALWHQGTRPLPADAAYTVLLAVGDVDQNGHSVLPGEGVVPLGSLLVGGYDSLAVLMLDNEDEDEDEDQNQNEEVTSPPEGLARAGYEALSRLLSDMGWVVDDE